MKVDDIIKDDKDYRTVNIAIHLKKKKKNNPLQSKTNPMDRQPDDSYGIAGSGDTGSAGGSIV